MRQSTKQAEGFTLIELMIVVAIISILSVLAVAGFSQSFRKTRNYQAAWQGMRNACVIARAEAIKQGVQLAVATSANQIVVFRDDNRDCKPNGQEPVFYTYPNPKAGDPTLTGTQSFSSSSQCLTDSSQQMFSFASTGELAYSDGGSWYNASNIALRFADTSTSQSQNCIVWQSGYVSCSGN